MKKDVSLSTAAALALVALAIFMMWGAFGGWSGTMGPGWSMMGSGWGIWSVDPSMSDLAYQMFYSTLCATAVIAVLVLWVARNLGKKKKSETQICPNCAKTVLASLSACPLCRWPLK